MKLTLHQIPGLYRFATLAGEVLHTSFSPKEIAAMYYFDAVDTEGNWRVIRTEQVEFKSFEYIRN